MCAMASASKGGPGGSSASSSAPTGPANATRRRTTASRPTTRATPTPQAVARTRATLNAARAGDPAARAAVNAAVAQAMKERGLELAGKPASAAQQAALLRDGSAIPEFELPTGPVPVPPPGGAANDNAAPAAPAAPAAFGRTPKQAAEALKTFLDRAQRFGGGADRPQEVRDAQRDMGITPDGIVGPITRKTASVWNVTLPQKRGAAAASKKSRSTTKKA